MTCCIFVTKKTTTRPRRDLRAFREVVLRRPPSTGFWHRLITLPTCDDLILQGYWSPLPLPRYVLEARLACDDDADAMVEAVCDGGLADDVRAGGAVRGMPCLLYTSDAADE